MSSLHHLAIRTADYRRFAAFYTEVFEAACPAECANPSVTRVGNATFHVFGVKHVQPDRGAAHLGHYAIELDDLDSFTQVRDRLLARSCTDGVAIDFGESVSLIFTDPDGFMTEVLVPKTEPWDPPFPLTAAE